MMWKKIWNDPVWSKVISAAILAVAALVGTYFLDWWPAIGRYTSQLLVFAGAEARIPNWLTGVATLLALPTLLLVVVAIWQLAFPAKPTAPDLRTYTSDNFLGLRWRWQFVGNRLSKLYTFCPHCDFQVFPERASAYLAVDRISFHCESCGNDLGTFEQSYDSLENKAARFAEQKLRLGTWHSANGA